MTATTTIRTRTQAERILKKAGFTAAAIEHIIHDCETHARDHAARYVSEAGNPSDYGATADWAESVVYPEAYTRRLAATLAQDAE